MRKLLLTLALFIFLAVYTLSDGYSYSGMLIGVLLLPIVVIVQLVIMKLLFTKKTKVNKIE